MKERRKGARLPDWAVMVLDGLLGSGALDADEIDALSGPELLELARRVVRHAYSGALQHEEASA